MKILFLTTHLNAGGITSYLHTLCKRLVKAGHSVYIVSSGGARVSDFVDLGANHTSMNIRTKSELNLNIYLAIPALLKLIKKNDIDVIHAHTRVTQVMGHISGKLSNRAFVSTCHGFFKTRLSRKLFPCWGRCVIAISPEVSAHLKNDFGVPPGKVYVIRNGIDLENFKIQENGSRQSKKREFGYFQEPIVGIIARLSDVKGHKVLIDAMADVVKRIKEVRLLIVGEGRTEQDLRRQVSSLGLEATVHFYPEVNNTYEFLKMLDIFVMPSLQEGLGLAVMEAQAAGLPVIVSRVGGLPNLVKNGQTGILVPPDDCNALADAIVGLLENPGKALMLGKSARSFVEKECSAEDMVRKTMALYEKYSRI